MKVKPKHYEKGHGFHGSYFETGQRPKNVLPTNLQMISFQFKNMASKMCFKLWYGFFIFFFVQSGVIANDGSVTLRPVTHTLQSSMMDTVASLNELPNISTLLNPIPTVLRPDDSSYTASSAGPSTTRPQNTFGYSSSHSTVSSLPNSSKGILESLSPTLFQTFRMSNVMTVTDSSFVSNQFSIPFNLALSGTSTLTTATLSSVTATESSSHVVSSTNSLVTPSISIMISTFNTSSQDLSIATSSLDSLFSSLPLRLTTSAVDVDAAATSTMNKINSISSLAIHPSRSDRLSRDLFTTNTVHQVDRSTVHHDPESAWSSNIISINFSRSWSPHLNTNFSEMLSSSSKWDTSLIRSVTSDYLTEAVQKTSSLPISTTSVESSMTPFTSSDIPLHFASHTTIKSEINSALSEITTGPRRTITDLSSATLFSESLAASYVEYNNVSSMANISPSPFISGMDVSSFNSDVQVEKIPTSTVFINASIVSLVPLHTSTVYEATDSFHAEYTTESWKSPSGVSVINENSASMSQIVSSINNIETSFSRVKSSYITVSSLTEASEEPSSLIVSGIMSSYTSQTSPSGISVNSLGHSFVSTTEKGFDSLYYTSCLQCATATTYKHVSRTGISVQPTSVVILTETIFPTQSVLLNYSDGWVPSLNTPEVSTLSKAQSIIKLHSSKIKIEESSYILRSLPVSSYISSLSYETEHTSPTDKYDYSFAATILPSTSILSTQRYNETDITELKNITLMFSLKGDCNFIISHDYVFRKFWRALSQYTKKASISSISPNNISLVKIGCHPFHAIVFISLANNVDITKNISEYFHFNISYSKIRFRLSNGTNLLVMITKYEFTPASSKPRPEVKTPLSEIVVITTAAIICGILIIFGIIIFIREYLHKRGSERFRFITFGLRGTKPERVALRSLPGVHGSDLEMQDNGRVSFDGGYSTIGSQKGRKTNFMTQADMSHSSRFKGKNGSLSRKKVPESSKKATSSSAMKNASSHPMQGYGLVIGLLGYKNIKKEPDDTYAVPNKGVNVQGIAIRSTEKAQSEMPTLPRGSPRRKDQSSPTPPPRHLRAFSKAKDVTDSVEKLVPSSSKSRDAKDSSRDQGILNPAYTDDDKKDDVMGSTCSVHI